MYSYEDRVKAVKLYIQYDCSFSSVKHELGYPENRKTLRAWYQEFNKDGDLHERYTHLVTGPVKQESKELSISPSNFATI